MSKILIHLKRIPLLGRVVIAIILGIMLGQFVPVWFARIFATFNDLFGNFLSFFIPLIILGLVAPAIGELGKGCGETLADHCCHRIPVDPLLGVSYLFFVSSGLPENHNRYN